MKFSCRTVFRGHGAPVYAVAADEQFVYSASGDRFVTRWNVKTGQQDAFAIKLEQAAYCLLLDEQVLYIGTANGTVAAVSTQEKQLLWEYNFSGNAVFSLLPTKQGILFGDDAGNLCLIAPNGTKLFSFPLGCGKIKALSSYQGHIYCGCANGMVLEFDEETFNETNRWKLHETQVNAIAIDGETLISAGRDAHLVLLDRLTGSILKRIPAHYQSIYGLLKGNGFWVTASMDKSIKIWSEGLDAVIQKLTHKEGGHTRSVNALSDFSNTGFVTASDDKTLVLWEKVSDQPNN